MKLSRQDFMEAIQRKWPAINVFTKDRGLWCEGDDAMLIDVMVEASGWGYKVFVEPGRLRIHNFPRGI